MLLFPQNIVIIKILSEFLVKCQNMYPGAKTEGYVLGRDSAICLL